MNVPVGLGIRRYRNLIDYIGVDEPTSPDSVECHTKLLDFPATDVEFPLRHPPFVVPDLEADLYIFDRYLKAKPSQCRWEWRQRQVR